MNKKMKKTSLQNQILWAVGALFFVALIFSLFFENSASSDRLTLNELTAKINSGEVSKIVVSGSQLTVTLSDDKEMYSKKEAESGLTETLKNYGVSAEALQKVSFEVEEESGFRFWAGILIPTLLPLIIIGVFFWMMFIILRIISSATD